jgi:FAD/FMN-containing dehydrogenase
VDRREFLRVSGRAVLGATLLGPAALAANAWADDPLWADAPGGANVPQSAWKMLANSLQGSLVRPGNPRYPQAHQLYDPRFDAIHPAGIVFAVSADDVKRSIAFARKWHLALTSRSGGHSYAGYSTNRGLVVDVSRMSQVSVDHAARTATVGAGAQLVHLYRRIAGSGLAVPGGTCPSVGVAGLALGGGQGVLGRKLGLTCDAIRQVRMVTADGALLTANGSVNPGLYWASRGGGGGNFGIVTRFVFRARPVSQVTLFSYRWPWSAAGDVLHAWQTWGPQAPDALWSNCHLTATGGPGRSRSVSVAGAFLGPANPLKQRLASLVHNVGHPPSSTFVQTMSYLDAMLAEAGHGGRQSSLAKSEFFGHVLPPAGIHAFLDGVNDRFNSSLGGGGGVLLDAYGGAINRVPPAATAFVHRHQLFLGQFFANLPTNASSTLIQRNRAWLTHFFNQVRPFGSGGAYVNYIDPALKTWQHAYYGSNLARLKRVKKAYDPDNVFHFPQSIPVAP